MSVGALPGLMPYYRRNHKGPDRPWSVAANTPEGRVIKRKRSEGKPVTWLWDEARGRMTLLFSREGNACGVTPMYAGADGQIRRIMLDFGDCPAEMLGLWESGNKRLKRPSPLSCVECTDQGLVFEVPPLLRPFPQALALQESEEQGTLQELAEPSALRPPEI